MLEFENWSQGSEKSQIMNDGEFDYSIDEDTYYYQTLELGSAGGNSPDSAPQFERRMIPNQSRDVMEEPVAEFSLNGDGDDM